MAARREQRRGKRTTTRGTTSPAGTATPAASRGRAPASRAAGKSRETFERVTPLTRRCAPPSPEGEGAELARAFSLGRRCREAADEGAYEYAQIKRAVTSAASISSRGTCTSG